MGLFSRKRISDVPVVIQQDSSDKEQMLKENKRQNDLFEKAINVYSETKDRVDLSRKEYEELKEKAESYESLDNMFKNNEDARNLFECVQRRIQCIQSSTKEVEDVVDMSCRTVITFVFKRENNKTSWD